MANNKVKIVVGFPANGGGGAVDSVNGQTGVVVLDKSNIGLSNVDNTSDADKPISDATQTALDDLQQEIPNPNNLVNQFTTNTQGVSGRFTVQEPLDANTSDAASVGYVANKIAQVNGVDLNNTLIDLKENFYTSYNGVDSFSTINNPITLISAGDSIEFDVELNGLGTTGDYDAMGIIGETGTSNSNIGFWNNGKLYIRSSNGTWLSQDAFNISVLPKDKFTLKLEWTSAGVNTFYNGSFQKEINTGELILSNIGSSYSSFFFDGAIKNIKISTNNGSLINIDTPYLSDLLTNNNVLIKNEIDSYISEDKINQLIDNNNFVTPSKKLQVESGFYYDSFNGVDSKVSFPTEKIANNGDFFEFDVKTPLVPTENNTLGIIGKEDFSNTFGFSGVDGVWFRLDSGTYLESTSLVSFSEWARYRVEVVNNGTQFEVSQNGVQIGLFNKSDDFIFDNIGFGYPSAARIDVKNVIINTIGNNYNIPILSYSNLEKNNITLINENPSNFRNTYVSYNPTGYEGNEDFTIYTKNKSFEGYYLGFKVQRVLDLSELEYVDIFRIRGCEVFSFDGKEMRAINKTFITTGESEFTYKISDRDDFTGGFHGDEIKTDVNFYIDNVRLTSSQLSESFDLLPCDEFRYIQKSTLHETAKNGIPNPSHPIEALHDKDTTIGNSGYITKNRVTWKKVLPIQICYLSLVSSALDTGEYCQSNNYNIETLVRDDGFLLVENNDNALIWNESNGMSTNINSFFDVYNDTSTQKVWDASVYNKYYRDTNIQTTSIDEVWNGKTNVVLNKLR